MPEIICVSCWKGFEVEEPPPPSVTCPICGFAQPGRVSDTTVGIEAMPDDDEPTEADRDPFESMEAELASDLSEAAEPTEPEEEDTRWRVQTHTGLLLFFPEVTLACQWADDQDDPELQIGRGTTHLRPYSSFQEALKTISDPLQALSSVAPASGDVGSPAAAGEPMTAEAIVEEASAPAVPITEAYPAPSTAPASSDAPASPDAPAAPAAGGEGGARPATMTSEFQFRTGSAASVWKGRMLLFVIGLLSGAGAVYYVAWLGVLPGILY